MDPLLRGHRACIVGNVVFVALFGGVIAIVAALRGPVILKSSFRRGLQLVRWPGSLILPATLAVDGTLTSAFFLVMIRGHDDGAQSPPAGVSGAPVSDDLIGLDLVLFVTAIVAAGAQITMMVRWSSWGLRHAEVVADVPSIAQSSCSANDSTATSTALVVDAPSTAHSFSATSSARSWIVYLLGLNYRWVCKAQTASCGTSELTASLTAAKGADKKASQGASDEEGDFASAAVTFQKCHGPLRHEKPIVTAPAGVVTSGEQPRDGRLSQMRLQWCPFYSAVDFACLLGSAMLQGAVLARPQQMCVPAVVLLFVINALSLAITSVLRPFLSPAKNVLILTSASVIAASSLLLVVATLSADETVVDFLIKGTVVLATLGSSLSCVTGLLSVCQRLYTLCFRTSSDQGISQPASEKDADRDRGRGMTVSFGRHLDQRLLDDADLHQAATTAEGPNADDPTQCNDQPAPSAVVAPVLTEDTNASLGDAAADESRRRRQLAILDVDGDTDGDVGALLRSSAPPVAVAVASCPRIAVRRSEEGQRRFDELQRLLLHHSAVGGRGTTAEHDDIGGSEDNGVGRPEPSWPSIAAPLRNRLTRTVGFGFDDL